MQCELQNCSKVLANCLEVIMGILSPPLNQLLFPIEPLQTMSLWGMNTSILSKTRSPRGKLWCFVLVSILDGLRSIWSVFHQLISQFFFNGKAKGSIVPSRVIWQGDPLSLYLFILITEGLSSLMQAVKYGRFFVWNFLFSPGPRVSYIFCLRMIIISFVRLMGWNV